VGCNSSQVVVSPRYKGGGNPLAPVWQPSGYVKFSRKGGSFLEIHASKGLEEPGYVFRVGPGTSIGAPVEVQLGNGGDQKKQ